MATSDVPTTTATKVVGMDEEMSQYVGGLAAVLFPTTETGGEDDRTGTSKTTTSSTPGQDNAMFAFKFDAFRLQSPRKPPKQNESPLKPRGSDSPDAVSSKVCDLCTKNGRKVLRKFNNTVVIASMATLCGAKMGRRLCMALRETSLQCYKTTAMAEHLNLVIPLSKHSRSPVVLGPADRSRYEISLCVSQHPDALPAVKHLKSVVSANFPLVVRLGTSCEFEKWFAELARRLPVDFAMEVPGYARERLIGKFGVAGHAAKGVTQMLASRRSTTGPLAAMVFWYYSEGDRSKVRTRVSTRIGNQMGWPGRGGGAGKCVVLCLCCLLLLRSNVEQSCCLSRNARCHSNLCSVCIFTVFAVCLSVCLCGNGQRMRWMVCSCSHN